MADATGKKKQKNERYKYLRLPLATEAEAVARRAHLIRTGTIQPETEQYACEHGLGVVSYSCPQCGTAKTVWR